MLAGYVDDTWIRQQTDHLSKCHHETAALFFFYPVNAKLPDLKQALV